MFSYSNGGFLMKKILFLICLMLIGANSYAADCESSSQCVIIGKKLIDQKEYKSAIECFDSAISMDEDDEFAYAFRARAKYYIKDYEGAVCDCIRVHVHGVWRNVLCRFERAVSRTA